MAGDIGNGKYSLVQLPKAPMFQALVRVVGLRIIGPDEVGLGAKPYATRLEQLSQKRSARSWCAKNANRRTACTFTHRGCAAE